MVAMCCYVLLPMLVGITLVIVADASKVQYEYETDFNKPRVAYRYRDHPQLVEGKVGALSSESENNDNERHDSIENDRDQKEGGDDKISSDENSAEDEESADDDAPVQDEDLEDEEYEQSGEKDEEGVDEAEQTKLDDVNDAPIFGDTREVPKTALKRNDPTPLDSSIPSPIVVMMKKKVNIVPVRVDYDMETDVEEDDSDDKGKVVEKRKDGGVQEKMESESNESTSKLDSTDESESDTSRSSHLVRVEESAEAGENNKESNGGESGIEAIIERVVRDGVMADEGEETFNRLSERVETLGRESLVDKILLRLDRETMAQDLSAKASRILEEKRAEDVVKSAYKKTGKREKRVNDVTEVKDLQKVKDKRKVAGVRSAAVKVRKNHGVKAEVRSTKCLEGPSICQTQDWGYSCENGPDKWVDMFPDCGGDRQSPINIDTTTARIDYEPLLKWNGYSNMPTKMKAHNNGHTALLTASYESCQKPYIWDSSTGREYLFAQLHFHWGADDSYGSEHWINYKRYPLEMHVVHFRRDLRSVEQASRVPGGLAIVSILYSVGKNPNEGLSHLQSTFNKISKTPCSIEITPFLLTHILQPFSKNYLTYNGSLTTPPCSETVLWIVHQRIQYATRRQLKKFREFRSDGMAILHNNRPIQPVNKRCVVQVA